MKEDEMMIIGDWIAQIIHEVATCQLPADKDARNDYIKLFRDEIQKNELIKEIRQEVIGLCKKFPLYG